MTDSDTSIKDINKKSDWIRYFIVLAVFFGVYGGFLSIIFFDITQTEMQIASLILGMFVSKANSIVDSYFNSHAKKGNEKD